MASVRLPRPGTAAGGPARRLLALLGTAAGIALVVFHIGLLWRRLADLTILDPFVALRWAGAVLLTLTMLRFRGAGVSLLRGRRAAVLWTLVLFLHAVVPGPAAAHTPAIAEAAQELLFATQVAVVLLVAIALLTGVRRARKAKPRLRVRGLALADPAGLLGSALVPQLASRPPPVLPA